MTFRTPRGDPVDKWAYRTAGDVETDIASLANGETYSAATYAYSTYIDGRDLIDVAMQCTVPDAEITGDLIFYWLLMTGDTWPTTATLTTKITPTRNTNADRSNQRVDVHGYKYLKVQKVANISGQTLTGINAEITGEG